MPTPPKTSPARLVEIGLRLVTEGGVEAVTVAAVAKQAGVKGPSIYKHFTDREALLTAIEIAVLDQLQAALQRAGGETARERLFAMAHAYRAFVIAAPWRYGILYRANASGGAALAEIYRAAIRPIFAAMSEAGVAEARLLVVARTLAPFLHGFLTMEIAQAFRLGGDLDASFSAALEIILREV